MKTVRFECEDVPGTWLELSAAWTRRELREALNAEGEPFAALLQRKVVACSLETGGEQPLTDPSQLTREALDEGLRYEVYCWMMTVMTRFVITVQRLGEATQRRLWQDLVGETAAATKKGTETTTATTAEPETEPAALASGDPSPSPTN